VALIFGHLHLRSNREKGFGLDAKTREKVALVPRVFIGAAVPVPRRNFFYARDLANFLFVGDGNGLSQRDLVPGDQSKRLTRCCLMVKERVVNSDQDAEQTKRNGDARDGENAPAPIAQAVLESQREITKPGVLEI
jgi:hypothetical protein